MKKTDYVFAIRALERMAHIAMSPNGWLPSPSLWRVTMSWQAAHNLCGEREFWKARDMTDYIDFLQGVIFG